MTTCSGRYCRPGPGLEQERAFAWLHTTLDHSHKLVPSLETDCGEWCQALSYLNPRIPLTHFSFEGYHSGIGLVYAATDEVWEAMQCLSVTDSASSTRACCTCSDPNLCPFDNFAETDTGYCSTPCSPQDHNCKQLAAGCGISVFDVSNNANKWHDVAPLPAQEWPSDQQCDRDRIQGGECQLCRTPLWCRDYPRGAFTGISTPQHWIDAFWRKDGGEALGSRQCKYQPDQKQLFIETMRLRFSRRATLPTDQFGQRFDHSSIWNEVNMYVDPADHQLAETMFDKLIGLVYFRSSGNSDDLDNMRKLVTHWRALGREVPAFALTSEPVDRVRYWRPDIDVRLTDEPYHIEQIHF